MNDEEFDEEEYRRQMAELKVWFWGSLAKLLLGFVIVFFMLIALVSYDII